MLKTSLNAEVPGLFAILNNVGIKGSNRTHYFKDVNLKELRECLLAREQISQKSLNKLLDKFKIEYGKQHVDIDFNKPFTLGTYRNEGDEEEEDEEEDE